MIRQINAAFQWTWEHPANAGARMRALWRVARYQARGRLLRKPTIADIGFASIEVTLHSQGAAKALYASPPDWNEMHAWRRILRPGDHFIDVGANAGIYALWAASCGARVTAVEPLHTDRLRRNLALNPTHEVEVLVAAASNHSGEARFDPSGDDLAHLANDGDILVQTITLDELIGDSTVAGVKVDVEGAERLVLEGARRALAEHRILCLQIEWNDCARKLFGETRDATAQLLRDAGYTLMRADGAGTLHPSDGEEGDDVFALPLER